MCIFVYGGGGGQMTHKTRMTTVAGRSGGRRSQCVISCTGQRTECMHNTQRFERSYNGTEVKQVGERMVGVRSHHTGGKTSSAILPKITSPGVAAARPKHPLPGPNTATLFPTHLFFYGKFDNKKVWIVMSEMKWGEGGQNCLYDYVAVV